MKEIVHCLISDVYLKILFQTENILRNRFKTKEKTPA